MSRAGRNVREIYTNEDPKEFFGRKEIAVEKLFESESAKRHRWVLLGKISMMTIATVIIVAIISLVFLIDAHPPTKFMESMKSLSERDYSITVIFNFSFIPFLGLTFIWGIIYFISFGLIPIFRSQPKMFEILEDRLRVVLQNGKTISYYFSDFHQFYFYSRQLRKSRSLLNKIIDPLGSNTDYSKMTLKDLMKPRGILPYSLGFGLKSGAIRITRKSGYERKRVLFPWLNTPSKSKQISLSPSDPEEFFNQLEVAIKKWGGEEKIEELMSIMPGKKVSTRKSVTIIAFIYGIFVVGGIFFGILLLYYGLFDPQKLASRIPVPSFLKIEVSDGFTEAQQNYLDGLDFLNEQDFQKALYSFENAIRLDSTSYEAYYLMGFLYEQMGETDSAIERYEAVLDLTEGTDGEILERTDSIKRLAALKQGS
ncbi:MAG: tetratricopeptide repeat protein [Candidatus Marinimicrobia bacterium]|nr:tetratricopeptide repeat protein [Candidatus Neomarinimicrobiota bacterium]